jgi:hypothetical protein
MVVPDINVHSLPTVGMFEAMLPVVLVHANKKWVSE